MNYYNPYFSMSPYIAAPQSTGLFSKLLGGGTGIKWGSILSGTQKALGFANQAIPMVKQVSPVIKNAKTMFKVMNEFKKVDINQKNMQTTTNDNSMSNIEISDNKEKPSYNDGPTFFI